MKTYFFSLILAAAAPFASAKIRGVSGVVKRNLDEIGEELDFGNFTSEELDDDYLSLSNTTRESEFEDDFLDNIQIPEGVTITEEGVYVNEVADEESEVEKVDEVVEVNKSEEIDEADTVDEADEVEKVSKVELVKGRKSKSAKKSKSKLVKSEKSGKSKGSKSGPKMTKKAKPESTRNDKLTKGKGE